MNSNPNHNQDDASTDDVVFEHDSEYNERDPKEEIHKLKEKLRSSEEERLSYLDKWQRASADFQNARKRDEERNLELVKYANQSLLEDLIVPLDSFDMAMANKESWENVPEQWRKGVEYIYSQLQKTCEEYGLKQFNPLGEMFNPQLHDAVKTETVASADEDGKILSVIQKGYTLQGKVIRSAKVVTGSFN